MNLKLLFKGGNNEVNPTLNPILNPLCVPTPADRK